MGMALYWLREAGAIGEGLFLAANLLVVAGAAAIFASTDCARSPQAGSASRFEEVPPPLDVRMALPPDWNAIGDAPSVTRMLRPVAADEIKKTDPAESRSTKRAGREPQ
jgi:hypothetical protein